MSIKIKDRHIALSYEGAGRKGERVYLNQWRWYNGSDSD